MLLCCVYTHWGPGVATRGVGAGHPGAQTETAEN